MLQAALDATDEDKRVAITHADLEEWSAPRSRDRSASAPGWARDRTRTPRAVAREPSVIIILLRWAP